MLNRIKTHTSRARAKTPAESLRAAANCLLLALAITFACEALSRHSPLQAALFLFTRPHAFLYNALIIACFLSLALLFKRRIFAYCALGGAWVILGVINCVTCLLRITPLGFYDFVVFINNMDITSSYISYFQLALIALALAGLAALYVLVFRRAPKAAPARRRALLFTALLCGAAAVCTVPYALVNDDYTDPMAAYNRYGFAYSLCRSTVDRGIARPLNYGSDAIDTILSEVGTDAPAPASAPGPNIILLQLESFYDPANLLSIECSQNPVPNFTALKDGCSSGFLRVPMIGGGTANVEFEAVTGMNLADFGTGEYPYSTILQSQTCETAAFDLKAAGYRAHAIHNHMATFYDRDTVFSMLGFDTFTSLEYMQNVTYNSLGWCRDETLTQCVLDALNSDDARDFVFCVSVQGHGKYPAEAPQTPYAITVSGARDEAEKNTLEYYVNELHDTDAFLGQLLTALEAYPEPVVLAVYGDHLPSLTVTGGDVRSGSLLTTEYALWSNRGDLQKTDRELTAYQLYAYVLERCGMEGGVLSRYHQQCADNADYLEQLQVIEYDMLYGDKLLYNGDTPYPPADMRMGVKDITVTGASFDGGVLTVTGEGFTAFSRVTVAGRLLETAYLNANTLTCVPPITMIIEPGEEIAVSQVSGDGTVLSHANALLYQGP